MKIKPIDLKSITASVQAVCTMLGVNSVSGAAILGSGYSTVVDSFPVIKRIPFKQIPALGAAAVPGHPGEIMLCRLQGKRVLFFSGRRHLYELPSWESIAFPLFLSKKLSSPYVLLTNAGGSLKTSLSPGDLMIISDHINLTGENPLLGSPASGLWEQTFLDQSEVYDRELRERLTRAAKEVGISADQGTFVQMLGPSYETPAEARMLQSIGGDAVGMSTAVEAMIAQALGLSVVGLTCISNYSAGISTTALSHSEVIDVLSSKAQLIAACLKAFISQKA